MGHAADALLQLRAGIHLAEIVVDELDIFGVGVNLAARLAGIAKPGQIVASIQARDALVPGLDADIEDLGECYLKHVDAPQRAFAVTDCGGTFSCGSPARPASVLPLLAVVPLSASPQTAGAVQASFVITDDLVSAFSRQALFQVMSRLSTQALATRACGDDIGATLRADYVLRGAVELRGDRVGVDLTLLETRTEGPVWSGRFGSDLAQVFNRQHPLAERIAETIVSSVLERQLTLMHVAALPNLPGYALLLQAIALVHRLSRTDIEQAQRVLDHLADRHPRAPEVRAWMAKWHFLQVAQAWTSDRHADLKQARHHLALALGEDPGHSLALAIEGHLDAFADSNLPSAERRLREALALNPNESLAWMFLANTLANLDRGEDAVSAVDRARQLSPLDPMSYFLDLCASCAYSAAGNTTAALAAARRSVALNGLHLSSLVQLIIAQAEAGELDDARHTAKRYLGLRPAASVQRFVDFHVAGNSPGVRRQASALLAAGIPL